MHSFEFKSRLAKLNSSLYVDDYRRRYISGEWFSSGIYSRRRVGSKGFTSAQLQYATAEQRQYLQDSDTGNIDQYVCGIPYNWIPEHDRFDLETGKVLAKGWRATALLLVKKGFCSLEKARRVFRCADLGATDYDKLDYDARLAWSRAQGKYRPPASINSILKDLTNAL